MSRCREAVQKDDGIAGASGSGGVVVDARAGEVEEFTAHGARCIAWAREDVRGRSATLEREIRGAVALATAPLMHRGCRAGLTSYDLASAAATTALRHELIELRLLLVREEGLDGVGHLRASCLQLRAGRGVATAHCFRQRCRLCLVGLVDRIGLCDDRVGDLERVLENRDWANAASTTAATTAAALSLCGRRHNRKQRGRHHRHPNHLLHRWYPLGSWRVNGWCAHPNAYFRMTTTVLRHLLTGAPGPAQQQPPWRQHLSYRPLAQTLKFAILTRPCAGRLPISRPA